MGEKLEESLDRLVRQIHSSMLKANEYDEGDLLYHRINYKLADSLGISVTEAEAIHVKYHEASPRRISEGFCDRCQKIVTLVPIIYGINRQELEAMKAREADGRLIIGDTGIIREGATVAMFGCRECKNPLPKYGTM
ncbi:MAG TPA: hypothetical protein VJL54_04565 [Nitrososphaera sp.]|nr:hypothetical protein [Nitrososphaera sp.]